MVWLRPQLGHDMADRQFPNLSRRQAEFVVKRVNEALGSEVAAMLSKSGLNPNHLIRFLSIASLCRCRRQEMGLCLKEASQQLKIPQYRLRAIEAGMLPQIALASLHTYIQFLGLADQFARWRRSNTAVYDEIAGGPRSHEHASRSAASRAWRSRRSSVVHIVVAVQVVPVAVRVIPIECIRIIVVLFILLPGFVELVQNAVDHPADGAGVLTDFLQGLECLFAFR